MQIQKKTGNEPTLISPVLFFPKAMISNTRQVFWLTPSFRGLPAPINWDSGKTGCEQAFSGANSIGKCPGFSPGSLLITPRGEPLCRKCRKGF